MKCLPRFMIACLVMAPATLLAGTSAGDGRQQLADQGRERLTTITRSLTIVNWVGRINELLARVPEGKSLGAKWNPKEKHWDKAVDELLGTMMKAFDDLQEAPEAHDRMDKPFRSDLTEGEAAEILALSVEDRRALDDYADTITLGVNLLEHRKDLKPGSPAYHEALVPLLGMAKIPEVRDVPKLKLSELTMRHYQQTRAAAVDFLRTAIDGQLQLYWFDHRDAITSIATKAAAGAAKSK